ncbi:MULTISPECIES: ImmA/IrrE family metallo-endopeptidase [unclassified Brevibacillus]|jgi:Zn-dependent peptidase ImmA (M78 family)|uniref:ImmA/IrrE family metallo-endopeptidase n=1 Tax=unclassified Brevibacillus TaxID=2684853 RepID=UPI001490DE47|nr:MULTISPECIES: ImmA/IrrE family metallo-endopeptidase [unclassified Brevibacillus]MBR8659576.1 ImmA/IrrE family metallo-endopeptidase [Brevibacillus sp. NL20B1]NNV01929.1 ImmA/IrrE family metallo-endopeptidase [Brevibacillus sp. MCWH]
MRKPVKQIVSELIKKHGTNDPFEIAAQKNIVVLFEELGSIYGYFNVYKRIPMIHINCDLNESDQLFTCAHELGHSVMHTDVNTPFLKKNTLFSVERIEREANEFAVELLMPDCVLYEYRSTGMTIHEAAAIYGVPREIAHLKKL